MARTPLRYDIVRALRDLADHLTNNPRLDPPLSVTTIELDSPALDVNAGQYTIWRDSAEHVGASSVQHGQHFHRAQTAIRIGDTVYRLTCSTRAIALSNRAFCAQVGYTDPHTAAINEAV